MICFLQQFHDTNNISISADVALKSLGVLILPLMCTEVVLEVIIFAGFNC